MTPTPTATKDLQLADVISLWERDGPWTSSIVKQVTETEVVLFRPYGQAADFSYTGGVICYIGVEEYRLPRDDRMVQLWERKELR